MAGMGTLLPVASPTELQNSGHSTLASILLCSRLRQNGCGEWAESSQLLRFGRDRFAAANIGVLIA
jgi:hypothetical protein